MATGERNILSRLSSDDKAIDQAFIDFVNTKLVGKTIASAEKWTGEWIFHGVILRFTDGSHIAITGQHDEGFLIDSEASNVLESFADDELDALSVEGEEFVAAIGKRVYMRRIIDLPSTRYKIDFDPTTGEMHNAEQL